MMEDDLLEIFADYLKTVDQHSERFTHLENTIQELIKMLFEHQEIMKRQNEHLRELAQRIDTLENR
jgi:uncharacterized coiled-coil protein SlyX